MFDLLEISPQHFETLIGQDVATCDSTHTLSVESVQRLNSPSPRPMPFSVVFRLAAGITAGQGTYRISHPQVGELELFLVPIEPRDGCARLEAVFN